MNTRKRSDPNRPSWDDQLRTLEEQILNMPAGTAREAAEQKAFQLRNAIKLSGWVRSGLQPPD